MRLQTFRLRQRHGGGADLVECRRLGISRVPTDTGELVGMDERGVGVWRLNRLQLEDAA